MDFLKRNFFNTHDITLPLKKFSNYLKNIIYNYMSFLNFITFYLRSRDNFITFDIIP